MTRILIAIGCNDYDDKSWSKLYGAENDATKMFEALVNDGLGNFSSEHSRLLLSPTLSEYREVISETLFTIERIDCLTIFYAGHGAVKDGTYFLTCRDSHLDRLSLTGLSTSSLFTHINEAKCAHTNIIIDACFAAGMVHDLAALLKPEIIGRRNSFSLSILAASSSNEPASEENGQGYCTKAILDCVSGKIDIPINRPTLDLLDIGLAVASAIPNRFDQNPEFWGLSIKGHIPFCPNPSVTAEPDFKLGDFALSTDSHSLSQNLTDEIWSEYFKLDEDFEPVFLLKLLQNSVAAFSDHPEQAANFVLSVATSFCQKINNSHSGFLEAEIMGTSLISFVEMAVGNSAVESIVLELCKRIVEAVAKGITDLNFSIEKDRYHLLSGDFSELYYLPLRISKILGWIGAAVQISEHTGIKIDKTEIKTCCANIIEHYSTSVFSVSDAQAPYLAAFASSASTAHLYDETETIIALMFNSFVKVKGRVTSVDVKSDQIIKYLISTEPSEVTDLDQNALAKPSELLSVFFVLYRKFQMREEIDVCLEVLDHHHLMIYVPNHYNQFSSAVMRDGQNYTYQIGHGIWALSDFEKYWSDIEDHIAIAADNMSTATSIGGVISSLVQPDRTAWYLLARDGPVTAKLD